MSQMSTEVVLKCSQCGGNYVLAHLSTTFSDPDATVLHQFMRDIGNNGLCPTCIERKNYKDRNPGTDFNLRPVIVDPGMILIPNQVRFMAQVEVERQQNIRKNAWERQRYHDTH